jgi:ABC-2 type transport system permease protein
MQRERLTPVTVSPIDFRPRLWYNPDLKSVYFMVPGLVGLLLQVLIPMITATAIVREKEKGNIEQLLVTPIKRWELMVGKLIPYVAIGMVIAILIVTAARFLFAVPIRGNLITLLGTSFIFLSVCLGVGLFASTIADNQQQAAQMVMLLIPPSILLSGFIFPREGMPKPIYYLSFGIPLTYYLTIVRGIILKGLGLMDLWKQILPLLGMAVGVMTLSVLKFRKRLS